MALVLPNPDYGSRSESFYTLKQAKKKFKSCFRAEKLSCQSLTDEQRNLELKVVDEILDMMDQETNGQGIRKKHGGRFVKQEVGQDEDGYALEKYIDSKNYLADF